MAYDMVRYERGQVWMIKWKNPIHSGHEQTKDRPWLILSIGKFNQSSGMITAVPITTRDKVVSPAQVLFTNDWDKSNVILCEQIRTFDTKSGEYILDYRGNLSPEILEKVDVALSVHLGMHYSPITLNKLYDSMEAIIKSVGYMQQKVDTPKFTDDDVIAFAEKLQSLVTSPTSDEVCATSESIVTDADKHLDTARVESNNPKLVVPKETPTAKIDPPTQSKDSDNKNKRNYRRWTQESIKEFLHDADTLPMKEVMLKWNISQKTRFFTTRNYVQSLLQK